MLEDAAKKTVEDAANKAVKDAAKKAIKKDGGDIRPQQKSRWAREKDKHEKAKAKLEALEKEMDNIKKVGCSVIGVYCNRLIHHDFYKDEIKKAGKDGEKQVATMKQKAKEEIATLKKKAKEEIIANKENAKEEIATMKNEAKEEINTKKRSAEDQLCQVKAKVGR